MKKWEIILLWIAGLWTVGGLSAVFDGEVWSKTLALILLGWVLCALVWLSVKKWPKQIEVSKEIVSPPPRDTKGRVPVMVAASVGFLLAIGCLLGWLNAASQLNKERMGIDTLFSRIATGTLDIFDCVTLQEPMQSRCVVYVNKRGPIKDMPTKSQQNDPWDQALSQVQQCDAMRAIFALDFQPIK
jgi:hypothetical protein